MKLLDLLLVILDILENLASAQIEQLVNISNWPQNLDGHINNIRLGGNHFGGRYLKKGGGANPPSSHL